MNEAQHARGNNGNAGNDGNVDPAEVEKFGALAARWWDAESEFKPLHQINPLRLDFIDAHSPLAGKSALDIGCGGGLLCEGMAARGARVTGIDAGEAAVAVARLHALESGAAVEYRQMTAEALAAECAAARANAGGVGADVGAAGANVGNAGANVGGASADVGGAGADVGADVGDAGANADDADANIGNAGANTGDAGANVGGASADVGGASADVGGAGANTGNADANIGDAGANTGDAGANAGDAGANTDANADDAGADVGNAGANTGNASANTGNADANTGDADANTGNAGANTGGDGGRWDVVCCLELLEHVPQPASVVAACADLVKPGGAVYFSTINRNLQSFLFAIVGAEYVLNLLPRGTHQYEKLIRPSELARWCAAAGLSLRGMTGLHYHPLRKTYSLGPGVAVNYFLRCEKE